MPTCPTCNSVAIPSSDTSLKCDRCKKHYHWNCTNLDDYNIKLHRKNIYKPWRCPSCVTTFCIKCTKKFSDSTLKIPCKKCSNSYHFSCSELSQEKFKYYQSNPTEKWECKKCIKNSCRKCNSSIHHKASIRCCACEYSYHYICWKIPINYKHDKNFASSWVCPMCKPNIFPFSSLTDEKVINLSNHRLEKYSRDNILSSSLTVYSDTCNICEKKLKKSNPGVPCSNCKTRIHVTCSAVTNPKRDFHLYQGNWKCNKCMSIQFPFFNVDKDDLLDFSYNTSVPTVEKRFQPEVTIEEKLKLMLSYSKDSPWYAYTHPDEKSEHEFFTDDFDKSLTIRPRFDYYDIDEFKKVKSLWRKNKTISLIHTNICSLQANIDHLEDLIHDLDYTFDVIALTETWHTKKSLSFSPKRMEGYLEYYGREGSSLKGGCGFYVKDSFTPIPRHDLEFQITDPGCETETCWIELVNNSGPNILIGVFYRHPSRNNHNFAEKLKTTLKKINREKKKAIICGDFNLNLLNFDTDKQTNTFLSNMFQQNFQPCITEPTRITNSNKPSLVDNIFINTFDDPSCGNILEHISYDHLPNFIVLEHHHTNKKKTIKKRDKKNFDKDKFLADLLDNGNLLLNLINAKDSESACIYFLQKYVENLDIHQPMRDLSKKEKKLLEKPWLTQGLLKSISTKRKLFKQFKNDKFKDKKSNVYQKYKTHNDLVNKLKKVSMKMHYQNYFKNHFANSRKAWQGINTLLNRHRKPQNTIYLEDNGFISDPAKVANKFNDFFLNVAENLSSKIAKRNNKYQDYLNNPNKSRFCLKETIPDEVVKIIKNLDSKKSSDIYNISPETVKLSNQIVADSIAIIFNRCIKDGNFPDLLKLAKVIPIHKGDSVLAVANYRPISLLPIFSKIFERLIYDQFIEYIDENEILSSLQFGFQRNKSTEHAISSIISNITDASSNKKSSYCIFLDFAKAFDTVNHKILIEKLKYYGVTGSTLNLFESYLSNRTQVVEVNGKMSDEGIIKHGVPQGSILGPLLFLLYINDISNSSEILKFFLFADDTTVFYSADPSADNTETILNQELEKVSSWLAANKLSLNVKKSNFLHFHHGASHKKTLNIQINGTPVEEKQSTKYLGTFIDNKLNWKAQIQHIKAKLARGIGMISKIRYYVDESCLLKMYHSFFQSHINYNLLNWSCTHQSSLKPIETKMKKALRVISFSKTKYDHTSPLFKMHKILPFNDLVVLKKATLMWQIAHGYAPKIICSIFERNQHNHLRFILPRVENERQKLLLKYSSIKAWNTFTDTIKNSSTLSSFKEKCKSQLLANIN